MPLDHISISVPTDQYKQTVEFYKRLLKPLNYQVRKDFGVVVGMGSSDAGPTSMDFWIAATDGPAAKQHVAFSAKSIATFSCFFLLIAYSVKNDTS